MSLQVQIKKAFDSTLGALCRCCRDFLELVRMEGSTMTFLPPRWTDQLSVMKIYEDVDRDEYLFNNYIWFKAQAPEDEAAEEETKETEEDDESDDESDAEPPPAAVLFRLRQQAAMFGATKHLKLLELAVEIAKKASERQVGRAEKERDDALDAVEYVTKKLLVVRDELTSARRERDDVRDACDDLSQEHQRIAAEVDRVIAKHAAQQAIEVEEHIVAPRRQQEEDDARVLKAERDAMEKERDEALRALKLLEQTSSSERDRMKKELETITKERDDKTEAWYRLNGVIEALKTERDAAVDAVERLEREKDDADRARERVDAVLASTRRDVDELRVLKDQLEAHRDQLAAELEYERSHEDAEGLGVDHPFPAIATAVVEEATREKTTAGDLEKTVALLTSERDEARADAEGSRRVIERMATELVVAREHERSPREARSEDLASVRRERDLLHAKLCSLIYDTQSSELFHRDAGAAVAMLDIDDETICAGSERSISPRAAQPRLCHPEVKEGSPLQNGSPGSWTTTSRAGWPPSRRESTSLNVNASKALTSPPDDLPTWVKRIAPYYTKADFDNVRLRCIQFEADMARAHRTTLTDNRLSL